VVNETSPGYIGGGSGLVCTLAYPTIGTSRKEYSDWAFRQTLAWRTTRWWLGTFRFCLFVSHLAPGQRPAPDDSKQEQVSKSVSIAQ